MTGTCALTHEEEATLRRFSSVARVQPWPLTSYPLLLQRLLEDNGIALDVHEVDLRQAIARLLNIIEERRPVREPARMDVQDDRAVFRRGRLRRYSPSWWADWLEAIAKLQDSQRPLGEASVPALRRLVEEGKARLAEAAGAAMAQEVRPAAWLWLAPANEGARLPPLLYRDLCNASPKTVEELEVESNLRGQILRDLERTPAALFAALDNDAAQVWTGRVVAARSCAAERLLVAYSRHRPSVGYCQGLNFVAALLLRLLDDASAFVVFCGLLERLPPHLYSADPGRLALCRIAEQDRLLGALAWERRDLVLHLNSLKLDFNLFLPRWLTCLFATVIPVEATLRLWDHIIGAGGGDAVPRLALALLCRAEAALLQARDFEEALASLSATAAATTPTDVDAMLCREWPADRMKREDALAIDVEEVSTNASTTLDFEEARDAP